MPTANPLVVRGSTLPPDVCARALESRDARFDGVFFVGITSTNIYCRPICPARVSYPNRRRFFDTAGAAEVAGYRPCLRCRPELAPGLAVCDAVSQLARAAVIRIAGGALNGSGVSALARELDVSERHLRRSLEREVGVTPISLAQTHRLLLAKKLLGETALPVTRIAYASGFQSLRRFNSVFLERYRLSPSAVRRRRPLHGTRGDLVNDAAAGDLVSISIAYRAPFAWSALLDQLRSEQIGGVELVENGRYARTVALDGHRGIIVIENAASSGDKATRSNLTASVSQALLPALMPVLARLRRLFDLDAEPLVVDAHLATSGLKASVRRRPGLRVPGAFDGFEFAMQSLMCDVARSREAGMARVASVARAFGEPIETGIAGLTVLTPDAARIADAGVARLRALGVRAEIARVLVSIAGAVCGATLTLDPSAEADATFALLTQQHGVSERVAMTIVARALHWPDAFPVADAALIRAAGCTSARELRERAEHWRPWCAYAARHLELNVLLHKSTARSRGKK